MEQHAVPRQITTFEFKLIGFMTLKQFIYLVVFIPIGYLVYKIFPVPILNFLLGAIVAGAGVALAFLPINDRPLDVWVKNFLKRLVSPTQYLYQKGNEPRNFFKNLYFLADPHQVVSHVESQEKLKEYLAQKKTQEMQAQIVASQRRKNINQAFQRPTTGSTAPKNQPIAVDPPTITSTKKPVLVGVVRNNKKTPLPGVLIYIKDEKDIPIRLLKTNPHGVFATYSSLKSGEYSFEIKDPRGSFVFDTMKVRVEDQQSQPLEFYSKELL